MDEPKKKKSKAGRRSRAPFIDYKLVKKLYEEGMTDKQVAKMLDISLKTVTNYKLTNKQFLRASLFGKKRSNEVAEGKLWDLVIGWNHGRPDRQAIMDWLCNRDPKRWRRRTELSVGGQYNNPDATPIPIKAEVEDTRSKYKDLPTNLLEQIITHLEGKESDNK